MPKIANKPQNGQKLQISFICTKFPSLLMTLPKILTMQIEFDMDCKYDALRIYDGSTDDEESLVAQLCYGKGVKLAP